MAWDMYPTRFSSQDGGFPRISSEALEVLDEVEQIAEDMDEVG